MQRIQGIHHITAVAGDPQRNVNFYHEVLGQRLVKTTVNFDDPGTYHLYYADEIGTPGTVLTFFPWRHMKRGVRGNGEVGTVGYTIPLEAVGYWRDRLAHYQIDVREETRFTAPTLVFEDPDGMGLELIGSDEPGHIRFWSQGPIPERVALRGFHSATLFVDNIARIDPLLTDVMGYTRVGADGDRVRYGGASDDIGLYLDLVERPGAPAAQFGAGSVHHIAFRTVDDAEQLEYQKALALSGYGVSPVRDRQYFNSIYFREPNGVLFEVATDAPGFLVDETVETLGTALKLPSWYESQRPAIEARLPKLVLPDFVPQAANG
ncbi:MAG: ring-cleaving dioxygenase [Chloroflexi bacterium]|nr:ring-cleaving dioxygenase [Chloroflexota bacterium]